MRCMETDTPVVLREIMSMSGVVKAHVFMNHSVFVEWEIVGHKVGNFIMYLVVSTYASKTETVKVLS